MSRQFCFVKERFSKLAVLNIKLRENDS